MLPVKRSGATALLLIVIVLAGCGSLVVRNPVPVKDSGQALVLGRSDLRWIVSVNPAERQARMTTGSAPISPTPVLSRESHMLALSGGGANGAFSAGVLTGWTQRGGRPQFEVVTGVSTGALSAPFAFLGSEYDAVLTDLYTTTSTSDLLFARKLLSLFRADSATDAQGLRDLVARHIDQPLLGRIAEAHAEGRRLYIATTNLDSGAPTIWDMGRIASLQHPGALGLFRAVMTASASVPVAFSPVYIPVQIDGRGYDEMHVDGGVSAQVFLVHEPSSVADAEAAESAQHVWVIRNARLTVPPQQIRPRITKIAGRSLELLIRSQGLSDLQRIYRQSQQEGIGFSLAYIGADFTGEPTEAFDPEYMRKLYEYGFHKAAQGEPWIEVPPEYGVEEQSARADPRQVRAIQ